MCECECVPRLVRCKQPVCALGSWIASGDWRSNGQTGRRLALLPPASCCPILLLFASLLSYSLLTAIFAAAAAAAAAVAKLVRNRFFFRT